MLSYKPQQRVGSTQEAPKRWWERHNTSLYGRRVENIKRRWHRQERFTKEALLKLAYEADGLSGARLCDTDPFAKRGVLMTKAPPSLRRRAYRHRQERFTKEALLKLAWEADGLSGARLCDTDPFAKRGVLMTKS